jgi:hypothetical protein
VWSSNAEPVFNIESHHQTNQEVLAEIFTLSQCQFLIHSLAASSEAVIWINLDLHVQSVNLEGPVHLEPASFETLFKWN